MNNINSIGLVVEKLVAIEIRFSWINHRLLNRPCTRSLLFVEGVFISCFFRFGGLVVGREVVFSTAYVWSESYFIHSAYNLLGESSVNSCV